MSKDNKEEEKLEKRVFEVRRTTFVEEVKSDKFVFEKHGEEWKVHFANASEYSLEQMKEIVKIMETMPMEGTKI